jgi:hypothetical protein
VARENSQRKGAKFIGERERCAALGVLAVVDNRRVIADREPPANAAGR